LVLWLGPLFVLMAGGLGAALYVRRRGDAPPGALSADEEMQVEQLLKADGGA
jgi:cytochrome c-type biogenesis protein CcmH/NrfF